MKGGDVAAIVLCAGTSDRFAGGNKLLQEVAGSAIVAQVVDRAHAAGISNVTAVTGFGREEVESTLSSRSVRTVFNEGFDRGIGTSIAAGVRSVPDSGCYAIWPGDMPFIDSSTVRHLVHRADEDRIVVPVCDGRRGHPVLFGSRFRPALLELEGDTGARSILERNAEAVEEVIVTDVGIHTDIDTRDNLERLTKHFQRSGAKSGERS